jgi:phosphomannomutase
MNNDKLKTSLECFKAYDIRGILGETIDEDVAYRIGRAFAETMQARKIVVGWDARETSPALAASVARGISDAGSDVLDIGLAGTEEMYFATSHFEADGGIVVTASHNPINYNGMKMVGPGSRPLDPATELSAMRALAESSAFQAASNGTQTPVGAQARDAYADKVMSLIDPSVLRPLKVVVNCGNGAAGPAYAALKARLEAAGAPLEFVDVFVEPDAAFPNGIPNPLLPENQPATRDVVLAHGADLGVAFDGDFDRCFFFDETGAFIDGEYVVGLLAAAFLEKEPGAAIVHDPRVVWSIQDIVQARGGKAIQSKTGHVFLKQELRTHGAVYGGEMSAHHYFRDFCHCDSGMIPWLLVCELMGRTGQKLSELVQASVTAFPSSGEINFRLDDPVASMQRVIAQFEPDAVSVDRTDGVSVALADWRFNLRASNTEPVIRLNVESRGDAALVAAKVAEIEAILNS